MADNQRDDAVAEYEVGTCAPGDLSEADMTVCVDLLTSGGAVDPDSAKRGLRRARVLAVARKADKIVAVGSVKQVRTGYAAGIAGTDKSGFSFAPDTPELGYIAVAPEHQGKRLSHRIVAELLSGHHGGMFATTYDARMKKTLAATGFVQRGRGWMGRKRELSLWLKPPETNMDSKEYEEFIQKVVGGLRCFSSARIERNRRFQGVRQPGSYEIDISFEVPLGDVASVLVIVECKNWSKPVDRPVIQALVQT